MNGLLNWEAIQRQLFQPRGEEGIAADWNKLANEYNDMASLEKNFTQSQINIMDISQDDTVVDIGCGPGRLSIPLSKKARSVTCVDPFEKMLSVCMSNAQKEGITNIIPLAKDWLDEDALDVIGQHDIVVASRSVGLTDLVKLSRLAKKYVYIMCFANAPSLRDIQLDFLKGVDTSGPLPPQRIDSRMFNYNMLFNIVYDLGANPNVVIVDDGFEAFYTSKEEAYEALRFVGHIPVEKEHIYRSNVDNNLTKLSDGRFHLLKKTQTYVMWWKANELNNISIG